MNQNKEELRQELYAVSPFDLCSPNDDKYRDAIDSVLDKPKETPKPIFCKKCNRSYTTDEIDPCDIPF